MNVTLENISSKRPGLAQGLFEAESLFRNMDPRDLVAPLRTAQAAIAQAPALAEETAREIEVALRLQENWEAWLAAREMLRNEVQRGRECLEQVRRELQELRWKLEAWPAYERICGHNPLAHYLQSLDAKERIERFLPAWLEQREEQLAALNTKMATCARQNGLEHLL